MDQERERGNEEWREGGKKKREGKTILHVYICIYTTIPTLPDQRLETSLQDRKQTSYNKTTHKEQHIDSIPSSLPPTSFPPFLPPPFLPSSLPPFLPSSLLPSSLPPTFLPPFLPPPFLLPPLLPSHTHPVDGGEALGRGGCGGGG